MNRFVSALLSLLALDSSSPAPERPALSRAKVFDELRMAALRRKPGDVGITRDRYPGTVWEVLMETGLERVSFTLVVVADGSASLYFSSGGGIIGFGAHDSVRRAGAALLAQANQAVSAAQPTHEYPLPTNGQTVFYLVSYDGVLKYSAPELELREGRDRLSALYRSAHEVISAIRELEERKNRPSPPR